MGVQTRPERPEPPKSWVLSVPELSRTRPELFRTRPEPQFSVNRRQTHPASRPHRGYESRLAWLV
jgi:hypothetical protein